MITMPTFKGVECFVSTTSGALTEYTDDDLQQRDTPTSISRYVESTSDEEFFKVDAPANIFGKNPDNAINLCA